MASVGAAIVLWMLLAAALGLATGWLLWGWWANRPPSDLPTDEELQRLRTDLELAREQVADLRAALAEPAGPAPARGPAAKRRPPPPPIDGPQDVTESDGDWGRGAFLLAARAQELASLPDLHADGAPGTDRHRPPAPPDGEDGPGGGRDGDHRDDPALDRVGGRGATASLRAVTGITVKVERALHRRGVRSLEQLAGLSDEEIAQLDAALGEFQGRIHRDDWVGQARRLLETG